MPKNGSPPRLDRIVLRWMTDVGGRLGPERWGEIWSDAVTGVGKTKTIVDRNVSSILSMLTVTPSRREYQRIQDRIDALQNSVSRLSRRLDELTRNVSAGKRRPVRKKARNDAATVASVKKAPRARRRNRV